MSEPQNSVNCMFSGGTDLEQDPSSRWFCKMGSAVSVIFLD